MRWQLTTASVLTGLFVLVLAGPVRASPRASSDDVAPPPPSTEVRSLAVESQFNVDAVGTHPGAILELPAWEQAIRQVGVGVATASGAAALDSVALRSATRPKAPKRIDVSVGSTVEFAHLLFAVDGEVPRGNQALRVYFTYDDESTQFVDLKGGSEVFPLTAPASSGTTLALPVSEGRALGLATVRNPDARKTVASLGVEVRSITGDTYIFAVSAGAALVGHPMAPGTPANGFAFDLDLGAPPPPIPDGWKVRGPAGAHGKVVVRDGHYAFEDGTRARFWGINLLQEACAPPKHLAPILARQLADYGFNLVRMHHCDTTKAGLIRADRQRGEDPLDSAGLDRMDFLLAELAKVGIYTWLEVATNRAFTEADGVPGAGPEIPNGHKLVTMFQPDWRKAYLEWVQIWLGRTNPYTGKRIADDPSVAVVELGNEHSMLVYFTGGTMERLPEVHRIALDAKWAEFVHQKYPDAAALSAAWSGSVNPGIRPLESYERPHRQPAYQGAFSSWPSQRTRDLYAFYRAMDQQFYADVAAKVKGLGFTVPLVGGITFGQPGFARIMGEYDGIDGHYDYDSGPGGNFTNESTIASPRSGGLPDRWDDPQLGMPFSISELSHGHPNVHQAESPLFWASMAALQDWDALIWLTYTNGGIVEDIEGVAGSFELRSAVLKWGQMSVASGLFRTGAVSPASGSFVLSSSAEDAESATVSGDKPAIPQLRDAGFLLANRVRSDPQGMGQGSVAGTPGKQVGWWVEAGRLVIDTPAFDAVLGDHALRMRAGKGEGGGPTMASALDPQLDGEAATSLTCIEGLRLDSCKRALLVVAGTMQNADAVVGAGGATVLNAGKAGPLLARPAGSLRFSWPRKPVVRPISPDGSLGAPLSVRSAGTGWWSFSMAEAGPTMWWEISG